MALTIKSFIDLMKSLPDANRCREFMEQHKWNGVPTCPHCNHPSERHYKLRFGGVFTGLYKCRHCKRRFNITTRTMFEGSNNPARQMVLCDLYVPFTQERNKQRTTLQRPRSNTENRMVSSRQDKTQSQRLGIAEIRGCRPNRRNLCRR